MPNNPALDTALAGVDDAKRGMDEDYTRFRAQTQGAPTAAPAMKKWTVKMTDGTIYRGVQANTPEEAQQKMMVGPQGPLAQSPAGTSSSPLAPPPFKPAPGTAMTPTTARTPAGSASFAGLPEAASAVGTLAGGPALAGAGLAADAIFPPKPAISGKELAGDLVPLAVGALGRPARTLGSVGKTLFGNVLGRGAVEAGAEALSPSGSETDNPMSAGIKGALKGILPGLVQGGVGAAVGPTKDTMNVQRAAQNVQRHLSPELAALIDPSKPAQLMSGKTVNSLKKAAGVNLDKMEAEIDKALGPAMRFTSAGQAQGPLSPDVAKLQKLLGVRPGDKPINFQGATGMAPSEQSGQTFSEIRAKIKELREIGDSRYSSPEMAATVKAAMKDASAMEAAMLQQMPPALAEKYRAATAQHASDSKAIRWIKGQQQQNAVSGGVNPQDNPLLGAAEDALTPKSSMLKAGVHGALGTVEALTGHTLGAGHQLGRAVDNARKSGPLRPAQTVSTMTPKISSMGAGVGTAALQTWLQKLLNPADERPR